jgi:hypothetical protein
MAINIIDNFKLWSNIPLDERYVVNTYNDVSAHWYPGMQVYQLSDHQIWYLDGSSWNQLSTGNFLLMSSLGPQFYWHDGSLYVIDTSSADKSYVDGSLYTRDLSLGNLSKWNEIQDLSIAALKNADSSIILTYVDCSLYTRDLSLGNLSLWEIVQDSSIINLRSNIEASINRIDTSLSNLSNWEVTQDLSIYNLTVSLQNIETSIVTLNNVETSQDGSITILRSNYEASINRIDTSLGNLSNWNSIQDVSLSNLRSNYEASINVIDISLGNLSNWNFIQDSSISALRNNVEASISNINTSLANLSKWEQAQDCSISNLKLNLEASIVNIDTSLGNLSHWEVIQDNSIINIKNNIEASINRIDTSLSNLSNWENTQDASINNLRNSIDSSLDNLSLWEIAQDSSITNVRSNLEASINRIDTSLFNLSNWENKQDGSIQRIDTSLSNLFNWEAIQDSSINNIKTNYDASILRIDTSLGNLSQWQYVQDLSISLLRNNVDSSLIINYIDGSLVNRDSSISFNLSQITIIENSVGNLSDRENTQDVSISNLRLNLESSINRIDISIGNLSHWEVTQDSSISLLRNRVDVSLGNLSRWQQVQDSSITNIRTNIEASIVRIDTSLFNLSNQEVAQDGSIQRIDISLGNLSYWEVTQDSSISNIKTNYDASINRIDTSLYNLSDWNITQDNSLINLKLNYDASIFRIDASIVVIDASLNNLSNWSVVQDLSIVALRNTDTSVLMTYIDGSLYIRDLSLNNLSKWEQTQDSSIVNIQTNYDASFSRIDTSLGNLSHWETTQDSSITKIKSNYDASINRIDTSLGNLSRWETIQDSSISNIKTNYDASINRIDTSLGNLSRWENTQDSSITNLRSNYESSIANVDLSLGNLTKWEQIQDFSINELKLRIDVSLASIDTSLGNLSNWNIILDNAVTKTISNYDASFSRIDTSLSNLSKGVKAQDGSIQRIDTSLGNLSHWETTQDSSIINLRLNLEASIYDIDVSLNNLLNWQVTQDLSINNLKTNTNASFVTINASLGNLSYWEVIQDSSISNLRTYAEALKTNYDASFSKLDASLINTYNWEVTQDSSISNLRTNVEALKTNYDASFSKLDASLINTYNWEVTQDSSISNLRTYVETLKTNYDASFSKVDTSLNNLSNWENVQDSSIVNIITNYDASFSRLDVSARNLSNWEVTQDSSIRNLRLNYEASINRTDASLNNLLSWQVTQDSSIRNLRSNYEASTYRIDTSLGNLSDWQNMQDTYINNLSKRQTAQDGSIINLRSNYEASIYIIDSSISFLNQVSPNFCVQTGLFSGGMIDIVDASHFSVLTGVGYIVNPVTLVASKITWDSSLYINAQAMGPSDISYTIYIDSNGIIKTMVPRLTSSQRRDNILLGEIFVDASTKVNKSVAFRPIFSWDNTAFIDSIFDKNPYNVSGNTVTANGANLSVDITGGVVSGYSFNSSNSYYDTFNRILDGSTAILFMPSYHNGTEWVFLQDASRLNPALYSNGTASLQSVSNNDWSVRLMLRGCLTGRMAMSYPTQTGVYASLTEAEVALQTLTTIIPTELQGIVIPVAWIILKGNCSSLQNTTTSKIITTSDIQIGSGPSGMAASNVSFVPDVSIVSTNVQDAIIEVFEDILNTEASIHQTNVDSKEPTGFVDGITYSYLNASTNVVSIVPYPLSSGSFSYYIKGTKYTKTGTTDITISASEGFNYVFYGTDGSLFQTTIPNNYEQAKEYDKEYAMVASLYWDASNNKLISLIDSRKGISMDFDTKWWIHDTQVAKVFSGIIPQNFYVTPIDDSSAGTLNIEAQYGLSNGTMLHGDIEKSYKDGSIYQDLSPILKAPLCYFAGLNSIRQNDASTFGVVTAGSGRVAYNYLDGSTWKQAESNNNQYVLSHLIYVNDVFYPFYYWQGINQYETLQEARNGVVTEIEIILGLLSTYYAMSEVLVIGSVIYYTSDSYVNYVKAKIVKTPSVENYVRTANLNIKDLTKHEDLTNLSSDDHKQYALLLGRNGDNIHVDSITTVNNTTTAISFNNKRLENVGVAVSNSDVIIKSQFDASVAMFALVTDISAKADKTCVDGSLVTIDLSLNWLQANKVNSSTLSSYKLKSEVDSSFNLYYDALYIDCSLINRLNTTDLSLNNLTQRYNKTEVSLGTLTNDVSLLSTELTTVDISLSLLTSNVNNIESSLNITTTFSYVDGSLLTRDASINSKVSGSGVTNQVALWDNDNSLKGHNKFIFDPTLNSLGLGITQFDPSVLASFIVDAGVTTNGSVLIAKGTIDNFFENNIQNKNSGETASSDFVAVADNGNNTINYIDVGINSSAFSMGMIGYANDCYAYSAGENILIGTLYKKDVVLFTGDEEGSGDVSANEKLKITKDGSVFIGKPISKNNLVEINGNINIPSGSYYLRNGVTLDDTYTTYEYVDGSISVLTTYEYVDGSLTNRDSSIVLLLGNKQNKADYFTDVSLNNNFYWNSGLLDLSTYILNSPTRNVGGGDYQPWYQRLNNYNEFRSLKGINGIVMLQDGSTGYVDTSIYVPSSYTATGSTYSGNIGFHVPYLYYSIKLLAGKLRVTFSQSSGSGVTQGAPYDASVTLQGSYFPWGTVSYDASGTGTTLSFNDWIIFYQKAKENIKSSWVFDASNLTSGLYTIYALYNNGTPIITAETFLERHSYPEKAYLGHIAVTDGSIMSWHESPDLFGTPTYTRERTYYNPISKKDLNLFIVDSSKLGLTSGYYLTEGASYKNVDFYNNVFLGPQSSQYVNSQSPLYFMELDPLTGLPDQTLGESDNATRYSNRYYDSVSKTYIDSSISNKYVLNEVFMTCSFKGCIVRGKIYDTKADAIDDIKNISSNIPSINSILTTMYPKLGYMVIRTDVSTLQDTTQFELLSPEITGGISGGGGSAISGAQNVGTGVGVYSQLNAGLLQFKSINTNGSDIVVSYNSDNVFIDASLKNYDVSINYLYDTKTDKNYVDGSLSLRDTSINWIQSNMVNAQAILNYVDPSLAVRDNSIEWLFENKSNNAYVDASLNAKANLSYVDGSLVTLETSINWLQQYKANAADYASLAYVDGSLLVIDGSIDWLFENKVNNETLTSYTTKSYVDVSLFRRDLSINYLYDNKVSFNYLDNSLNKIDSSINWLQQYKSNKSYVDASLVNIESSLYSMNLVINDQDVSIGLITSRLNLHDASLKNIYTWDTTQDASITSKVSKNGDTMTGPLVVNSSVNISENIRAAKIELGTDLTAYTITDNQSVIKTRWGLQLSGMAESHETVSPVVVGSNNSYNVVIATDSSYLPIAATLGVVGGLGQTTSLQVWQNNLLTTVASIDSSGSGTFNRITSSSDGIINGNLYVKRDVSLNNLTTAADVSIKGSLFVANETSLGFNLPYAQIDVSNGNKLVKANNYYGQNYYAWHNTNTTTTTSTSTDGALRGALSTGWIPSGNYKITTTCIWGESATTVNININVRMNGVTVVGTTFVERLTNTAERRCFSKIITQALPAGVNYVDLTYWSSGAATATIYESYMEIIRVN